MDQPHPPQRKNKKKRKGRGGSGSSGSSSPLAQTSTALLQHGGGLSRESSSGSLTLDPASPSISSTPPPVDKNLLNEILGEIRDLKQRLPGSPGRGNTPPPEEPPAQSAFLQQIESEKNRVRMEMEKKILEEENAKLRQKNADLSDQFEFWKNRYNKLEDEVDSRRAESDEKISDMYSRIGELEATVASLEAEKKQLLLQLKSKDEQLDTWKEKYMDLQNSSDKHVDITKVKFDRRDESVGTMKREKGENEKAEKVVDAESSEGDKGNHKEERREEEKQEKEHNGKDDSSQKKDSGDSNSNRDDDDDKKDDKGKKDVNKEEDTKEKAAKEEVKEIVDEVVEEAVKEAAESAKQEVTKQADTKSDESEEDAKERKDEPKVEQKEEAKEETKKEEPPKRRHRSRLEKAMASGKLENMSTNTLDSQFAKAIQHSKSGSHLPSLASPTSSKSQELEAIADILKHDSESALSPEIQSEPEPDDLMLNLNKITYRDGTMGRLPSTYSFTDLDQVPSYGSISDDDKTPTPTPVTTLRGSGDRKKPREETAAQAHERKVVLVQSLVRRHAARKKYKMIRKRAAIAREIFVTERAYVKHLHTCIKVFLRPLRQRAIVSEDGFIAIEKLQTIFSTFEIIMKGNYTFLKRLHAIITKWNADSTVGSLLIELLPLLEPHIDYIVNFEHAQTLLKEAIRDSASFAMFLRASLSNPDLECHDMADFLIMPVQRIPRYVMLFQDLLKNTPPKHPDYNNLSIAVGKIKEFADMINDRKRSHYKIFQIKDCITGVKVRITEV